MANYFVNLPKPEMPRNALMDFSPITNALDGIKQQKNIDTQRGDMLDQRNYARGRDKVEDNRYNAQLFAKKANAIAQMEGPQKEAAWRAHLASHPDPSQITPDYADPNKGPAMVAAEYGLYFDETGRKIGRQMNQAQLAGMGTSNALNAQQLQQLREMGPLQVEQLKAQTQKLREGDPVTRMLMDILKGNQSNSPGSAMSPSPQQPGPRLIPQSAPGQVQQPGLQNISDMQGGDPNLILAQQAQPQQAAPQAPMVQTPMGMMPQDKARQIGFVLALGGKGDAGKMLSESPNALGKEGANLVDKNMVGQFNNLGRLEQMVTEYDPKLQSKQARAGQWFNQQLAGWNALGENDKATLTKFVQQRQAAINNFNIGLKEASGTAVSAQEFERNQAELPNPGTGIVNGIFDGDDPVTYHAKMKKGIQMLKFGMARNAYLKNQGFSGGVDDFAKMVPVEQMPAIINKRANELESQLKASTPNASKASIDQAVRSKLKQEFGI